MPVKSKSKSVKWQLDVTTAPQQPFMEFEESSGIPANSSRTKSPIDRGTFTVHKGALADNQDDSIAVAPKKPTAQPFVKWAGGKRNLMNSIKPLLPPKIVNYYENFVGGGALFFAISDRIEGIAYLSDNNLDLVLTYQVIKKDPTLLIARLKKYAGKHSKKQFYKVRDEEPNKDDAVEVAARFIYLNKTCFNGLFRVNKSGKFNVPMGDYLRPKIIDEENLMACHRALQKAEISFHQYKDIEPKPKAGDFVYLDPPYHPTSDDSFTAYTKENFTEQNQSELRDYALEIHKAGAKVMLSNSKTRFIGKLYSDKAFRLHTVKAPRTVNCKPTARGAVDEYIITTY